jgi:hypothetical protein
MLFYRALPRPRNRQIDATVHLFISGPTSMRALLGLQGQGHFGQWSTVRLLRGQFWDVPETSFDEEGQSE